MSGQQEPDPLPDRPRMCRRVVTRPTAGAGGGRQVAREKFNYDHWIARTVEVMSAVRRTITGGD